jgi:hypothetical protein
MRTGSITNESTLCGILFGKAVATIFESAAATHCRRKEELTDVKARKVCARLWFAGVVACNGFFALAVLVSFIKYIKQEDDAHELSSGTQFIICFLMPVCLLADLVTDVVMLVGLLIPLGVPAKRKQVTEEEIPGPPPLAVGDIACEIDPPLASLPIASAPPLAIPMASAPPMAASAPAYAMQLDPSAAMEEHEFEQKWSQWPGVFNEERDVSYAWSLSELQAAIAAAGFVCMAGVERNGQLRCYALGQCASDGVQCLISIRRGTVQKQDTQQFALVYKTHNTDYVQSFVALTSFL